MSTKSWTKLTWMLLVVILLMAVPTVAGGSKRVRVAVVAFDTYLVETNWQYAWDPTRLGPLTTSLVTKELARHQQFDVVERRYLEQLLQEQDLGLSGRFDAASAAEIGRLLGAQVVVVGDVEHFGASESGAGAKLWKLGGKLGVRQRKVRVELGARFVDASTGRILGVGEGKATVKSTGFSGYLKGNSIDASKDFEEEASKVLREAVDQLGQRLAAEAASIEPTPLLTCIEARVATVDGSKVYLAVGAAAPIERGQFFEVRNPGKPIPDPDDPDKILGYIEESVGWVEVIDIQDRLAVARAVRGSGFAAKQLARIGGGPDHPDLECLEPRYTRTVTAGSSTDDAGIDANGHAVVDLSTHAPASEPLIVKRGNRGSDGDPDSADISTAGHAPRASADTPVGEWRLDVNETTRYWIRHFLGSFAGGRALKEAMRDHEKDEDIEEWRQTLRGLHMRLSVFDDGTFYLEMKDPADRGLTTIDGTWERKGIHLAIRGAAIDGIEQEEPQQHLLKPVDGRLYLQPKWKQQQGQQGQMMMAPWLVGTWAFSWPTIDGAVFARDELAQR